MSIITSEKQKDNLAKLFYDIGKIIFAVIVIGPFAKPESFNLIVFIVGLIVSIIFFRIGYYLDRKEVQL